MKNIISALIIALYQHETWNESVIADQVSVDALADIASILKNCDKTELALLEAIASELATASKDKGFSDYCKQFADFFIRDYHNNWE